MLLHSLNTKKVEGDLMKREQVENKYKWKIEDIFATAEDWEKLYKQTEKSINFDKFKGNLNSAENILACFKAEEKVGKNVEKLYLYAHMKHDENTADSKYIAFQSKAQALFVKYSSALSFVMPELTKLDDKTLKEFEKDKRLKDYNYTIKNIIKQKPHTLSEDCEKLLAMGGEVYSSFKDIFGMIDNADLPLPEIIDENTDEKIKLSHGVYGVILHGEDRELRKKAFKAYYKAYIDLINTISSTYFGNVKKDVYLSLAKNYKSCLERALQSEDVSEKVYKNLITSVEKSLPSMHKYIALRKKLLNLKEQHMYDIYAPLVSDAEIKLDYEDAFKLVVEGLSPLGEDYQRLLLKGYNEGWIDVCETDNKRSGAYSTGCFGVHPYVLLNYQKTTHDVFTIAHEMGHALHTYFSNKNQPYSKADYTIFVAEVASTVNEVLLLKHILSTTTDVNMKKYLLNYYLDTIRTTLHRQTMFAEFEYIVHDKVEKGEPLTKQNMCDEYLSLNKKYYGEDIVHDDEIAYEWARIPHFYSSFYVYKYSTGIISAISIANRILTEGEKAVKDYFAFLSSGGSDSPVKLLKVAGVDLETEEPFKKAFEEFDKTIDELESLS